MKINSQNIEEYIILYLDRELKPNEEQELLNYLAEHPESKIILNQYQNAYIPASNLKMQNKNDLLKKNTKFFKPIYLYAASLILLLTISFAIIYFPKQEENIETIAFQETLPTIPEKTIPKEAQVIRKSKLAEKRNTTIPLPKKKNIPPIEVKANSLRSDSHSELQLIASVTQQTITILPDTDENLLVMEKTKTITEALPQEQAEINIVNSLQQHLLERTEQIKEHFKNAKNTQIQLAFGDKQIILKK